MQTIRANSGVQTRLTTPVPLWLHSIGRAVARAAATQGLGVDLAIQQQAFLRARRAMKCDSSNGLDMISSYSLRITYTGHQYKGCQQ